MAACTHQEFVATAAQPHPGNGVRMGFSANGGLIVVPSYDQYARDVIRPGPLVTGTRGNRVPITVYGRATTLADRPDSAARAAIQLLLGLPTGTTDPEARVSWLLSAAELIMPGVAATFAGTGYDVTVVPFTRPQYDRLRAQTAEMAGGQEPVHSLELWAGHRRVAIPNVQLGHAAGVFGLLAYAIAKTPNGRNDAGFLVKRPRAAAAAMGIPSWPHELVPQLDTYRLAAATYVATPSMRIATASTLVKWDMAIDTTFLEGVMVANTRLWRGHGVESLRKVKRFLLNWGHVVAQTPGLQSQVVAYEEHDRAYEKEAANPLRAYLNVIYGKHSTIHAADFYGDLTSLARDVEALDEASMAQYGRVTPERVRDAINATSTRINAGLAQINVVHAPAAVVAARPVAAIPVAQP